MVVNSELWILGFFFIPPIILIIILLSGLIISRSKYYEKYHKGKYSGHYNVLKQHQQQQQQQHNINKQYDKDTNIFIDDNLSQYQQQQQDQYILPYETILNKLEWLKIAMKLHGIADLLGGIILFVWPESAFIWFGFEQNDNVVFLRLVAAALFAITYVSIKAGFTKNIYHIITKIEKQSLNLDRNESILINNNNNSDEIVNSLKYYIIIDRENINYISAVLDFKIIWAGVVSMTSIFYSLEKVFVTPQELPIAWGTWLIMTVFLLGFIVWIIGKITVNLVIEQLKTKLSFPTESLSSPLSHSSIIMTGKEMMEKLKNK